MIFMNFLGAQAKPVLSLISSQFSVHSSQFKSVHSFLYTQFTGLGDESSCGKFIAGESPGLYVVLISSQCTVNSSQFAGV